MYNTQKDKIPIDNPYRLILLALVILTVAQGILVILILSDRPNTILHAAPEHCNGFSPQPFTKLLPCLPIKHTPIIEVQNV
jgi:hypothetical protein